MTKGRQIMLVLTGAVALVYGMIYVDVVWRAKEAYDQGEKYWRWTDHPDEYANFVNDRFQSDKATLDAQRAKGRLTSESYDRELQLLQFGRVQALKESTIKYAYVWYQTAVELFSPPESKWVKLSREKMPLAHERWKAELRAKNIPFEEYMVQ